MQFVPWQLLRSNFAGCIRVTFICMCIESITIALYYRTRELIWRLVLDFTLLTLLVFVHVAKQLSGSNQAHQPVSIRFDTIALVCRSCVPGSEVTHKILGIRACAKAISWLDCEVRGIVFQWQTQLFCCWAEPCFCGGSSHLLDRFNCISTL